MKSESSLPSCCCSPRRRRAPTRRTDLAVSGRPVRAESRPKFPQQLKRAADVARVQGLIAHAQAAGRAGRRDIASRCRCAFAGLVPALHRLLGPQQAGAHESRKPPRGVAGRCSSSPAAAVWILLLWSPLPTLGSARGAGAERQRPAPAGERLHLLALGHVLSTVAPAYGTVSFTNVVKTLEPLFTCIFSAVLLNQVFSFSVYASLLPVIVGVIIASSSEVSFVDIAGARRTTPPARPPADHPRLLATRRSRGCSRTCALRCARSARSR